MKGSEINKDIETIRAAAATTTTAIAATKQFLNKLYRSLF